MATDLLNKHAQELRDTWQGRILGNTRDRLFAVVTIILFHEFPAVMPVLLRVVFPDFSDLSRPFLCGPATIVPSGKVVCSAVNEAGSIIYVELYNNQDELIREFRDLADRLKLSDSDRVEMFAAVQRWVACDLRVDHMGEKKKQ